MTVSAILFALQVGCTIWLIVCCVQLWRMRKRLRLITAEAKANAARAAELVAFLEGVARAARAGSVLPIVIRPEEDDDEGKNKRGTLH